MAGKAKSQWDFSGELFPTAEMRRVFSVSELTGTVRRLLEERVGQAWVTGEVSNLRAQSSGHIYFSLKDANAQLACVCFRDEARSTRHLLSDGQKVILQGELTVYEARGQYQLLVHAVELAGVGALQAAFERLKAKLNAEGLFAPERKRPIPEFVARVGIVSSPTGAALRDVLNVFARRQPSIEVVLAACRVQGQAAGDEIACALRLLNRFATRHSIDVILLTRGGGSLEDLWAFNEEVVARAIFESRLPVISAVGHEIDFTISDFVADVRAATPTAGAELLTEGMFRRREWTAGVGAELLRLVRRRIADERDQLQWLQERLARTHPRRRLNEQWQHLDDLYATLFRCARRCRDREARAALLLQQRLARVRPSRMVALRHELLLDVWRRLNEQTRHAWLARKQQWVVNTARLRLLSPQHVLERGFSITRDAATGRVLRTAAEVKPGQALVTRLQKGEVRSTAH